MISPEIQTLLERAEESHEVAGFLLRNGHADFSVAQTYYTKFHRYILVTQKRREVGHYGVTQHVSPEEAAESFQWAEEFMQAVKEYLGA